MLDKRKEKAIMEINHGVDDSMELVIKNALAFQPSTTIMEEV